MNMLLSKIAIALIAISFSASNLRDERNLLLRASKKNKAAFASDYLFEAFSKWNNHARLNKFRIDSVFNENGFEEVWLSRRTNDPYQIALTLSLGKQRQIIDIRRLFIKDYSQFKPFEIDIVKFLEKFIWTYEIGDEIFMQDFLYSDNIKIQYKGLVSSMEVIQKLRSIYGNMLPFYSVSWEGKYPHFLLCIVLDSPIAPLEIRIDLDKYLTSHYFDISDQ